MDMSPAARRRRRRRVPDENRKRAPRACTRCKARKSRCIEIELGACQRCRLKSLPCIFERQVRSPSATNVSALVETSSPAASGTTGEALTLDNVTDPSERFMWPRFLSKLRETFSLDATGQTDATVAQPARLPPALSPADLRRLRKAADAFPPRPVADFLLSVCIEHGTDSFYYFDQVQFLAEIDEFYTDSNSRLRYDTSFICLAYAAFALGSQWTTLARPDGRQPPPILQEDNDPGRIFYNQARSLIPDVIDLPCLRAVQATFVLGVYLLPASSIGSAYVYLGLSLRKALAMDLHLNADEVGVMDDEEKEVRKRIWWAVYSLERSTTIKLNRPRTVNPAIITVGLPQLYPALDDKQKFNNIEHQIADARLMLILDRVSEPSEWTDAQSAPGRFGDELKQWKRSLPPSLKLTNVPPKSSSYRATFHLYLNYYFAWIAMGKVSVVTVVRARTLSTPPHVEEHTENMSRSCVKAARKMLGLFEELTRTGNLTRFSFTDFQGCSIATIVILLAGIIEHDDPSFERLATFGLNCLRKMAEGGNGAAKTGVGFVEALQSITNEASEKLKNVASIAALAPTPALSQEHYNGWVEWLQRQPAYQFSPDQMMTPAGSNMFTTDQQAQFPSTSPEAMRQFSRWDGAAALQQLSAPAAAPMTPGAETPMSTVHQHERMFSTLYADEQAFLMGLTGWDVLGVSELYE
ncbi:fungal-specific transcription factor domain-containing protein [Microdochium trichocladiopsis]|uniref:Fungal-specific transcription factor domain-containing protein n=1 Tax=Microdochium trichocladiopsis TaxID=1682393 RepID=A0A9P9BTQ9_9PEZI|nr:fungal-specific transcription factor domain-containing protein [Microdochium trichocladiopsis]KAH7035849.1 fungal-specific transcription factor domain-containing protein [Microdochium trichocladiopsis]